MEKNAIKITENLKRMIINEHPYAISKGADGRWRTTYHNYCFDRSTNEQKKKLIERALSQVF